MPSSLQLPLLLVFPTGVFLAFLRAPHWFSLSLHRHKLWSLRDAIVDDMISNTLPKDHPAVRQLVQRVELAIGELKSLSALTFYIWAWVRRRADRDVIARMRPPRATLAGLDDLQQLRLKGYSDDLQFLCASSTMTGTWMGILTVVRFVAPTILEMRREKRQQENLKATFWIATTKATEGSNLGRCSADYVTRDLDTPLAGVS